MDHGIILSRLKPWHGKGCLAPCGRYGYKLVDELLLENIDVQQPFIQDLIDSFGPFKWQIEETPEATPEQ